MSWSLFQLFYADILEVRLHRKSAMHLERNEPGPVDPRFRLRVIHGADTVQVERDVIASSGDGVLIPA